MPANINKTLQENKIRRRALVSMYERRLSTQLDDILRRHNQELVSIANRRTTITAGLITVYNREIRRTYRRVFNMALTELNRLYASEAAFNASQLNTVLRNIYDARQVPSGFSIRDLLIRDNKNLSAHLASISTAQRRIVNGIVRNGIATGLANSQIVSNIRRRSTSLARTQVAALTRTAVTQITNDASNRVYQLNDDVIRGYQYVATLDGRTSIICGRLDGRTFSLNSEFQPRPPQHFNCRSTTIPVVKSAGQLMDTDSRRIRKRNLANITAARRASINGAVPARTTYAEWLTTQPNEIRLNLLGSQARVNLFNQGNLTLTQFSNREGRLLSIERLEELSSM